jgi:hypothetical protein
MQEAKYSGRGKQMILRASEAGDPDNPTPGWKSFAESQRLGAQVSGYVSQPAHARLAGVLAANLLQEPFGQLPPEVVETVAQHDMGWSIADLAALESIATAAPASFLCLSSQQATDAWRRSIRAAEEHSPVQAVLISRHFCLLAPRDGDSAHETFMGEENRRREPVQKLCGVEEADLDRYTAALGFCDLVSLLLCSGLVGSFEVPLAHPAHPEACNAPLVIFKLDSGTVSFDSPVVRPGTTLYADAWTRTGSRTIGNQRWEWKLE